MKDPVGASVKIAKKSARLRNQEDIYYVSRCIDFTMMRILRITKYEPYGTVYQEI